METNEMIKTLQKEGYIVKKEPAALSGNKISWNIRNAVFDYVKNKYEWGIYKEVAWDKTIPSGYRASSKLMHYIKACMYKEWEIKNYTQIPDMEKVIQWGKEWIDKYIENNKEEWDKKHEEFKKQEAKREAEYLMSIYYRTMKVGKIANIIAKRWLKRRKQNAYENDLFCYAEDG